jgi:hypothetical protein
VGESQIYPLEFEARTIVNVIFGLNETVVQKKVTKVCTAGSMDASQMFW